MSQHRVWDKVRYYQPAGRATDPNPEIANGVGEHELFGGLNLDRRVQLLEFLILPDEFADNGNRSASDCKVTLSSGDFKGSDQCVGGGGVEVKRQDLHGCQLVSGVVHGNGSTSGSFGGVTCRSIWMARLS